MGNISRDLVTKHIDTSSPPPGPPSDKINGHPANQFETGPTAADTSTKHTEVVDSGEDPNLFEEEQHQLAESQNNTTAYEGDFAAQITRKSSPAATEVAHMERLNLNGSSIPKSGIGNVSSPAAKKKGKQRFVKTYDLDEPIVLILDSLGGAHPRTSRVLKTYLQEEGRARRSMDATITQNAFYPRDSYIPMQPNFTDCGVYVLGYLQKFLANPDEFVAKLLKREMDVETDWSDMSAPAIRNRMREILQEMAEQQRKLAKEAHKQKKLAAQKAPEPPSGKPMSQSVPEPVQPTLETPKSSPQKQQSPQTPPRVSASQPSKPEGDVRQTPVRNISPMVVVRSPSKVRMEQLRRELMGDKGRVRPEAPRQPEQSTSSTKQRKALEVADTKSAHASFKVDQGSSRAKRDATTASSMQPGRQPTPPTKSIRAPICTRETLHGSFTDPISIDDSLDSITANSPPKPKDRSRRYNETPIPLPAVPGHTFAPAYPKKVHIHGSTPERETSPALPRQGTPLVRQPTPPGPEPAEHRRTHSQSVVIPESQDIDSAVDDSFVGIDDQPRTSDGVLDSGAATGGSMSQSVDLDAEEEGDRTIPESEDADDEEL